MEPIFDDNDILIAECCHIEAAQKGGERYNALQTDEERRSADNLLFLCSVHHIKTNNVETYTVDVLKKIKQDHERKFKEKPFSVGDNYIQKVLDSFEEIRVITHQTNQTVNRIEDKQNYIIELIDNKRPKENKEICIDTILRDFQHASFNLDQHKNTFSLLKPEKIERKATTDLFNWVNSDILKETNIAVLKGDAGYGKSVILNNLNEKLKTFGVPTIAFKADVVQGNSIIELSDSLALTNPILSSIQILSGVFPRVVVIIDQIDALSQTLSANRKPLQTYILLIKKLEDYENVRIIISTRDFDLNYDAQLAPYKNKNIFDAGRLTKSEVEQILTKINVFGYNHELIELLRTPLHLELFCTVYNSEENNVKYYSQYDLYNEIWKKKIAIQSDSKIKLQDILYCIADKIYRTQTMTVSCIPFDSSLKELNLLNSEGLIIINKNELRLFHQTFYEYLFARQFVESNKNMLDYLNENNQGLFIRSCLKIILIHLREYDGVLYKNTTQKLIENTKIRYHLKLLIINYLGFIQLPNKIDKEIVERFILDTEYEVLFLESIYTTKWLEYCIENKLLDKYLNSNDDSKNIVYQLLRRNIDNATSAVIKYLSFVPKSNSYFIALVLWTLKKWDISAINLFNCIKAETPFIQKNYCHFLEQALPENYLWVLSEYKCLLESKIAVIYDSHHKFSLDYNEVQILEELFKIDNTCTLKVCLDIIEKIIEKFKYKQIDSEDFDYYYDDWAFCYFDNRDIYDNTTLLQIVIHQIELTAIGKNSFFRDFIHRYKHTKSITLIKILISGYTANPKDFAYECLCLIKTFLDNTLAKFYSNESLPALLKNLIEVVYPHLNSLQKSDLNRTLLAVVDHSEKAVLYCPNKMYPKTYGRSKYGYLCSIPEFERNIFPEIKRTYQELQRKFGPLTENKQRSGLVKIPDPYNKNNLKKMPLDAWENTFKKINSNYHLKLSHYYSGGIYEHSIAFQTHVVERPNFFYPLIEKIIKESTVDLAYLYHGLHGLIVARFDALKIQELYIKFLEGKPENDFIILILYDIEYLLINNPISYKLIDFLCFVILIKDEPKVNSISEDDSLHGLCTAKGFALRLLMRIKDKKFESQIFNTIDIVANQEQNTCILEVLIHYSSELIFYDEKKAFNIFIKLCRKFPALKKSSIKPADTFASLFFEQIEFTHYLESNNETVVSDLGKILFKAWLRNEKNSEKYLFEILQNSSKAVASVIDFAFHDQFLIKNGSLEPKCVKVIEMYLDCEDNDVVHAYSVKFLHLKTENFEILFPLLIKIAKSKVLKMAPGYFCGYIIKCSFLYPHKCAELVSNFDKLVSIDLSAPNHYNAEPIEAIISIYNVLGNSEKDESAKDICMDVFDKMLKIPHLRNSANTVISLIDN